MFQTRWLELLILATAAGIIATFAAPWSDLREADLILTF